MCDSGNQVRLSKSSSLCAGKECCWVGVGGILGGEEEVEGMGTTCGGSWPTGALFQILSPSHIVHNLPTHHVECVGKLECGCNGQQCSDERNRRQRCVNSHDKNKIPQFLTLIAIGSYKVWRMPHQGGCRGRKDTDL